MQGKITENFTWEEAQYTSTGLKNEINNDKIKRNVEELIKHILQPLRNALNIPITINSLYRSYEVNKAVGGSANSQHLLGQAADIKCSNMLAAFNYIKDNLIFDQLIWEVKGKNNWIHVSYRVENNNRMQILVASYNKDTMKMVYNQYKNGMKLT